MAGDVQVVPVAPQVSVERARKDLLGAGDGGRNEEGLWPSWAAVTSML